MSALFSLIPTAVALGLLLYGLGGQQPSLPRNLWLLAGAIIVGPVAVTLLGFVGWLLMVTAVTFALVAFTVVRSPVRG